MYEVKKVSPTLSVLIGGDVEYLEPKHSSQKSFYKKATVVDMKRYKTLISYQTCVATYYPEDEVISIDGFYSVTTSKHITEFMLQCLGLDKYCLARDVLLEESKSMKQALEKGPIISVKGGLAGVDYQY